MIRALFGFLFPAMLMGAPLKQIGVFCATDEQVPEAYKKEAHELGRKLAESDFGLMTGGGNTGLMNAVMNGFDSYRGSTHLRGVIPSVFKLLNVHHLKIPEANLVWTDTIYQRLQTFHDHCDTMVVLPGGFGTLHELMDFIVPKQWGLHQKKIILLNLDHFWDYQILQFQTMVEKKALKQKHLDLLTVVTSVDACIQALLAEEKSAHAGLQERYWEKGE